MEAEKEKFKKMLNIIKSKGIYNRLLKLIEDKSQPDNVKKYLFLLQNEDISFFNDFPELDSNYLGLLNDYETGIINIKRKSLILDYNIKVYIGREEYVSYRNLTNLYNEVLKLMSDNLTNFVENINKNKSLTLTEDLFKETLCNEFLCINNSQPGMLKSGKLEVYSSLLNYTHNEIGQSENLKNILGNFEFISENYINNETNWDELHKNFQDFLEKLKTGTINY